MQRTYGFDVRSTVTLPHFSVTETVSLPKSAAIPETTAQPEQQTGRWVLESAPEREIAARRDTEQLAQTRTKRIGEHDLAAHSFTPVGALASVRAAIIRAMEIAIVQIAAEFAAGLADRMSVLHSSSRDSAAAGAARRRSAVVNPLTSGG